MTDHKPPVRVYARHVIQAGYCLSGAKKWAVQLGIDWRRFVREGASVEEIMREDNVFTRTLVKTAEREHNNG